VENPHRTAGMFLGLGLLVAIISLVVQGLVLRHMSPEMIREAATAGPPPTRAAPAPKPSEGPATPPASPSASSLSCKERLRSCFEKAGKDLEAVKGLGECYAGCVGLQGEGCDRRTCGDRCEGWFELREDCP